LGFFIAFYFTTRFWNTHFHPQKKYSQTTQPWAL
jgi:hypothetical protein